MSLIRIRSSEIFAEIVSQFIPELNVCGRFADAGKKRKFPSLEIIPVNHKNSFDQDGDVWKIKGQMNAVLNLGRTDALFQLRLGASNETQRAVLEDKLTAVFLSQEDRPGVLVAEISDCDDAIVGYELDQSRWENEAAFASKWFSITTMNVVTPILVERSNIPTWEEIRMCLAAELKPLADIDSSTSECVAIDANGNITITVLP